MDAGGRELDAAGIRDPVLRGSYAACRALNARHGRTYFLATRLLPPDRRPSVHALYGFARYADEIVDDLASTLTDGEKAEQLAAWGDAFLDGATTHPADDDVLPAIQDTRARHAIPRRHFEDFLASMRMDLTVDSYATDADLAGYVHGSAAVIGLQMVPVLGTVPGLRAEAETYAAELGVAFQLSNFLRDVGEDLRRGRLYLPLDRLAAFGVTREQLQAGVVDGRARRLFADEVQRVRALYRSSWHGIRLLEPVSRPCIEAAWRLYGGILDEVEAADYQVLDRRVGVPVARRLRVALPLAARAIHARQG
jgi:phytoene synthase